MDDITAAGIDVIDSVAPAADPDTTAVIHADAFGLGVLQAVGFAGSMPPDGKVAPACR